jgi:hypothetical protein
MTEHPTDHVHNADERSLLACLGGLRGTEA